MERGAAAARVRGGAGRRRVLDLRRPGTSWLAMRAPRRFGAMDKLDRAVGGARARAGVASGGLCWSIVWPESTRPAGLVVLTLGTPADLSLYSEASVMPEAAKRTGPSATAWSSISSSAPRRGGLRRPAVALRTLTALIEDGSGSAAGCRHTRPPCCTRFFGAAEPAGAHGSDSGRPRAVLGELRRNTSRLGESPRTRARGAPSLDRLGQVAGAGDRSALLYHRLLVALDRHRGVGFRVHRPAGMSSVPLKGLDRYTPSRQRAALALCGVKCHGTAGL